MYTVSGLAFLLNADKCNRIRKIENILTKYLQLFT